MARQSPQQCEYMKIEQAIQDSLHRMQANLRNAEDFIEFRSQYQIKDYLDDN